MKDGWFSETLYPDFRQLIQVDRVVYQGKTGFQDICILDTPRFGRMLTLDGIIQTSEKDEFCYHEMIVHVPMIAHGAARNVLIIGGGDGGALEEALKHPLARVTMVELDRTVVDLCRQYLPSICGAAFDDPRADLVFMDGLKFVRETDRKFDVIIIDSTDPIGPGEVLFSEPFYADCRKCLTGKGVLVAQSGVTFMQDMEARDTFARMKKLFTDAALYFTQVPTYGAGLMTFGWGCNSAQPRATPVDEIRRRAAVLDLNARYYTPEIHQASFTLPAYIEALKG